jgi:glycosyltransferase involved in cell wall biosynthesis
MRVLQVVKTSDGAGWAANQAEVLVRSGIDVHVVLPRGEGKTVAAWRKAGAYIHVLDLALPLRRPYQIPAVLGAARRLVDDVQPDIIHSHFVTTTLTLRMALGKNHRIPRVYQVAGPLHLEYWYTRSAELAASGDADYWVGSSRCIVEHSRSAAVPASRLFLSYYGWPVDEFHTARQFYVHHRLGIPRPTRLVGNINIMYPPKRFLGQTVGLKCHEDVIDALGMLTRSTPDVKGVLIGDSYGMAPGYEEQLRRRAAKAGGENILMPGLFDFAEVARSWPDFDCAVHVPLSENCGGVIEPLLAGVPVVASGVGGLPDVVIEGVTGRLVPPRDPARLAGAINRVLHEYGQHREMALTGRALVQHMFSRQRTGNEIVQIYRHILHGHPRPVELDSRECVRHLEPGNQQAVAEPARA